MINVDLVENIDFYAGAFPAARGNALSSVMEFSFKEARTDEWTANMVVGTSDLGLTLEGPTGENSSLIFSMRRSYLQFVFEHWDFRFCPFTTTTNSNGLRAPMTKTPLRSLASAHLMTSN